MQEPEEPASELTKAVQGQESRRLQHMQAVAEVIIAIAIVLATCYVARLPLLVLLISVLLAFLLAPLRDIFERMRLQRSVAAALAVVMFVGAGYGIVHVSYIRAASFVQDMPRYLDEFRKVMVRERPEAGTEKAAPVAPKGQNGVKTTPWWQEFLGRNLGPLAEIAFMVSFIPFLVYFMLTWQEHVRGSTVMLFRMEHRNTAYLTLGLISSMIRSFIVGNMLVGFFIGTASTIAFGLLGLPYFYFFGYISGFISLVPYLGVPLALLPPMAAGLGHVSSTQLIGIAVTVFGLHLLALNVLYPKFLGSRLQLNPLTVTVALLFWGWLWGAAGLILAIPIVAALKIICDHVEQLRPYGAWLGE